MSDTTEIKEALVFQVLNNKFSREKLILLLFNCNESQTSFWIKFSYFLSLILIELKNEVSGQMIILISKLHSNSKKYWI